MLFKFYLEHDVLGSLQINEPDGWRDLKLALERDTNFKSLIEHFVGSFIFYGDNGIVNGGIDRILEVERDFGPDAKLIFRSEVSFDGYTFEDLFEGLLNLFGIIGMPDNKIQVPVIPNDVWTKFINRLDTPVDIQDFKSLDDEDIDVFDSINLKLTSQVLRTKYLNKQDDGEYAEFDGIGYYQLTPNNPELDEVDKTFNLPFLFNTDRPAWWLEATYDGNYAFDFRIEVSEILSVLGQTFALRLASGGLSSPTTFVFQKNDDTPIDFARFDHTGLDYYDGTDVYSCWDTPPSAVTGLLASSLGSTIFSYSTTIDLKKRDVIRIYLNRTSGVDNVPLLLWGTNGAPCLDASFLPKNNQSGRPSGMVEFPTYFSVIADTIYPESNAFSFLAHDAAGQILDRIVSENGIFYSEHLGSDRTIYRQYPGDGCGWKYAISKGLQIRQYSLIEKPFFMSFNQWWKGINPVLCLGLGQEEIDGVQVIRVEQMDHFYDASSVSVNISNVQQITRNYDQDVIFKTVKVGYSKWQSEDISGIDDAQTKHTYATRLQKSGNDFIIESDFIAASLAIERTRRATKIKSADDKYDNESFLIAINPIPIDVSPETSPDVNDYEPELDENFSSITNLLNAETRYNSRITPARNLMRWIRYVSGCLQSYIDSKFKFVSGEGNYDMTSDMINTSDGCDEIKSDISEKQDLPVYDDPLHLSFSYEIVVPLEWEDYLLIRNNRKKAIGISQTTTGHVKFFIDTLEYELVKGIATIKAWPVEYFEIQVIETTSNSNVCYAVPGDCDDAYLTEDGFEMITESGDCLILN